MEMGKTHRKNRRQLMPRKNPRMATLAREKEEQRKMD